ncbi:AmmeMemoRadiSam system radical SAM enzyme [Nanoarchaeota archaeon]
MKEAKYWKVLESDKNIVNCLLCPRKCVVADGEYGKCNARKNIDGRLFSMVYGKVVSGISVDPIEKKPLYHFLPGTKSLSFGTAGCNLHCLHCQNWQISQTNPEESYNVNLAPSEIVDKAIAEDCATIAFTYTEPTIFFEYMIDTAKIAKEKGVKCIIVSNGFINPEPLKELMGLISGANIDFKGNDEFYKKYTGAWLGPIKETMVALKKKGIWLELTTLIIPTKNDSIDDIKKMVSWVKENLGSDVPWHFSAYYPCYKMDAPATSAELLKEIRQMVMGNGMKYVYAGNIMDEKTNSTFCSDCSVLVVDRIGFGVNLGQFRKGKCINGHNIDGVWK